MTDDVERPARVIALEAEVERLEVVIAAADKMREGIREASIKREPGLYECVMRYDALRATLDGATT